MSTLVRTSAALAAVFAGTLLALPASAVASGVVGTGMPGSCTEGALDTALASGGSVTFNCGASPVTITVTTPKVLAVDTRIDGGNLITLSGGGRNEVLGINVGVTVTLANITISDANSGGSGAAIFIPFNGPHGAPGGTLNVVNSTFSNNSALYGAAIGAGGVVNISNSTFVNNRAGRFGGAIINGIALTVSNSTFVGNTAAANGGAIYNFAPAAALTVTNCTFDGNSATEGGGAIFNLFSTVTAILANTVVANSTAGGNCSGAADITDGGHNIDDGTSCGFSTGNGSLSDTDPDFDPAGLQDNGGPTRTLALQSGSPAINRGDESVCSSAPVNSLDQRGVVRPALGLPNCSIGAYEYNVAGPADCCQCMTSCTAPSNGSCGDCGLVVDASCQSGDCVLHPSTPTRTPTKTPTSTPTLTPGVPCVAVPRTGCQPPQRAAAINLNAAARRVGWKWLGGSTPSDVSQFGDPVNGATDYHLCVYDTSAGPPGLAFSATVPAGGSCGTQPCWKQTHNRFSYTNTAATPDGVRKMTLQASRRAGAYIAVSGRGAHLHMPVSADGIVLLREFPEVIVQLQRSDSPDCWEAVFTGPPTHDTRWAFADRID